jgi:hypothetical protein
MQSRQQIGDAIQMDTQVNGLTPFRADGRELAFASEGAIVSWSFDPEQMLRGACTVASRNLTQDEWRTYLADLAPYQKLCPDYR